MRAALLGLIGSVTVVAGCGGAQAAESEVPQRSAERCPTVDDEGLRVTALERSEEPVEVDAPASVRIIAVDVGQGDSTLVVGPDVDGHRVTLLMDAGDNRSGIDGSEYVGALLDELGIEALDYVVLSHYDADHMGGFVTIGQGRNSLLWEREGGDDAIRCEAKPLFPRLAIFDVGDPVGRSRSRTEWRACVAQLAPLHSVEHAEVRDGAHVGRVLDLGAGWTATVVAGGGYVLGQSEQVPDVDTPNELSIALLVSNREGFDFLVTGDLIGQPAGAEDALIEPALARQLVARGVDLEVLRIGHHGAANATAPDFVNALRPEVAIISTGDGQDQNYRHPRCETLTTCAAAEVEVIQTEAGRHNCDELPLTPRVANGDVEIVASGASYVVRTREQSASRVTGTPTVALRRACNFRGCGDDEPPATSSPPQACCRVCAQSVPCGDSCIPADRQCHRPAGCACAAAANP